MRTLRFRLKEEIFEFTEYEGNLELIEVLEIEEGEVIDVIEEYSVEMFKEAHINYKIYMGFCNAIEDIETRKKLWTVDELKSFKYDLDKEVLKWLIVRNNKKIEKTIKLLEKENVNFGDIYTKDEIEGEIIGYYLLKNVEINYKFYEGCKNGHIKVLKWLKEEVDIHHNEDEAFEISCKCNRLEIAKWLYNLGGVNINTRNSVILKDVIYFGYIEMANWLLSLDEIEINKEEIFREGIISKNSEMVKWIYGLGGYEEYVRDVNNFIKVCERGEIELGKWLYERGGYDLTSYTVFRLFMTVCGHGKIEMAKWLNSFGIIDIYEDYGFSFKLACYNNQIEVAKWLYSLGGFSISEFNNIVFTKCCEYGSLEVLKWINEIERIDKEYNDKEFLIACKNGNIEIAKWLYSLKKFRNKEIIIEARYIATPKIEEWLENEIAKQRIVYIDEPDD